MKRSLVDILACPVCGGRLKLGVTKEDGGDVRAGCLTCTSCRQSYPIEDGIPDLLPPRSKPSA